METLILAAFEPELEPLRKTLRSGTGVTLATVGIGIAEAAARTAVLLAAKPTQHVLFIGSAGSSDPEIPLLALVTATEVILADPDRQAGRSYLPSAAVTRYSASVPKEILNLHAIAKPYYSPAAITSDLQLAIALRESTGASIENLELFGIAAACAAENVAWSALSVITNHIGPQAHQEWKNSYLQAAELTAAAVLKCENWLHGES